MQTRWILPIVLAAISGAFSLATPQAGEATIWLFDMGTESSPVADGYIRITPESQFSAQKGYGWKSIGQAGFDVERPAKDPAWDGPSAQLIPREFVIYKEHDDLTRDGVRSRDDLIFQVNLPNGRYRVAVTLGNLVQPICSQQVYINDELVAVDIDAKHFAQRGEPDNQYGFPRKVRAVAAVKDRSVRIRIHGDDSKFRARFLKEFEKPIPTSYLTGAPFRMRKPEHPDLGAWGASRTRGEPGQVWVWEDIGGPFTENSVMAVEIYPFVEPPLWRKDGKLTATIPDSALQRGADLFNAGRFAESEKAFEAASGEYGCALGYLWLAGRPEYEEEQRLVPAALKLLERAAPQKKGDRMFAEILENARRMNQAIYRFVHRADRQRTYNELLLISGEVASMQPEDPTYYKGLIYAGRGFYMIIPHRWTFAAGAGRQLFEKLKAAGFADNRFVRWYLDDHWTEHTPDWVFPDYSARKQGAPAWAAEVYEAFNRELDLAEWWIRNRQAADGSLGGGWGDDVEILRTFGTSLSLCPDSSPLTLDGVRKLANGAWDSGSIDRDAGYFASVSDTEHSGEWTADTLTAMVRIDYGNPVYVERGLKTARLMRDLWMDSNPKGYFLMRSNFLGATGIGMEPTRNDSRINYRPAAPARAVFEYNNLPTLKQLFVRWADSWLAASLSTDRGKPRGIIPQEIGFEDGRIGGVRSPNWYTADHSPGTVNYDWEGAGGYHDAIVDLFLLAYRATGERKYLEPMDLEAAFVRQHCPKELLDSNADRVQNPAIRLTPGSDEWIASKLAPWPRQWDATRRILFPQEFPEQENLWDLAAVARMAADANEGARRRWPHVTAECIATDRVYWPGLGNARRVMSGLGVLGFDPLVTYRGLGRDFAAALLSAHSAGIRVAIFNISPETRNAAVVPWILDLGAEYLFRLGSDQNHDGKMDQVVSEQTVRLEHRGQEVSFQLPGRTQYVVEMKRTAQSEVPRLSADLALSSDDVQYLPEYGRVDITVHNLGSMPARGISVTLYDGDREIGRQRIPGIEAPLGFDPKTVRVGFRFTPERTSHTFKVVVDSAAPEITKRNNTIVVERATPSAPLKQHATP
jgi:hypothetical protein